jgi:hypothetical protein
MNGLKEIEMESLSKNPLENIENTKSIEKVFFLIL